jgi:type II secretory pathway predicted ATPase ExeA
LDLLKESNDIAYSYVFNSRLTPLDFLRYMIADFGMTATDKSKSDLLHMFADFLASRGADNLTTVLVIDEAHDLSDELLEEIRLLSNIETSRDKLLQIILVGQPELDAKIESTGLRQLKQRIALRARLRALNTSETACYITQRVEIAGSLSQLEPIFPAETINEIFRYSEGIPRLINTICENALVLAYAEQSPHVTPSMIQAVARDFRLNGSTYNASEQLNGTEATQASATVAFADRPNGSTKVVQTPDGASAKETTI